MSVAKSVWSYKKMPLFLTQFANMTVAPLFPSFDAILASKTRETFPLLPCKSQQNCVDRQSQSQRSSQTFQIQAKIGLAMMNDI